MNVAKICDAQKYAAHIEILTSAMSWVKIGMFSDSVMRAACLHAMVSMLYKCMKFFYLILLDFEE